jgi:hypothetical protein
MAATLDSQRDHVECFKAQNLNAWVCITQESDSKLLAIIRAAHALLAAGDAEAARDLLASFSSPGVDALC